MCDIRFVGEKVVGEYAVRLAPDHYDRFAGRQAELGEILARARSAASGLRQIVVVVGRPGIGKTALLRQALSKLTGFRQLVADCAIGSTTAQLLRQAGQYRPGDQAAASLTTVLGGQVATSTPLVLALDHLQCADADSARELSAALSASRTAPLLILVAVPEVWRPEPPDRSAAHALWRQLLSGASASRITLSELSVTETGQLLGTAPTEMPDRAALDLHRYTGGHPALLTALLDQGLTAAHSSPADLLGLFGPFVLSTLYAVSVLPPASRDLLAAIAVADEPWPLAIAGSVAQVDDPPAALEPLLDSGLVTWIPADPVGPVSIRYPMFRDIVYRSLPALSRETLHSRAAGFALGTQAWAHRVAAAKTAGPDLAVTLEQEAERYHRGGDSERAGTLLMWAAGVSSDHGERERFLLRGARWWLVLRAVDWGPRLEACLSRWPPSASRSLVLGVLAASAGQYQQARAWLAEAAGQAGNQAEGQAAVLGPDIELATVMVDADLGDLDAQYRRSAGLLGLEGLSAGQRGWAEHYAADAWSRIHGPAAALGKLPENGLAPFPVPGSRSGGQASQSVRLWTRGSLRLMTGRLHDARADLSAMLRAADRSQVDAIAPMAYAYLGFTEYLLGDVPSAEHAIEAATALLSTHPIVRLRVPVHAVAACLDAVGGRAEAADRHVRAAQRSYAQSGPEGYAAFPALAAAMTAQAHGDFSRMAAALRPLAADPAAGRLWQAWWLPLHVEALIGTGQLTAAQQALSRLRDLAATSGRQGSTVMWLRAWLAAAGHDELRARTRFEEAAATPAAVDDIPLHRARLEHDYGRFLMSGRNRRAAIARFRQAYELYRVVGARPFAARCARDLEACGAQVMVPGAEGGAGQAGPLLSSRERRIAYLAAQGLTNQEIANEVYISAKTVEYHLGKVFAKLGITSRRQLPARLGVEPRS